MTWNDKFLELFRRCLSAYQGGNEDFSSYYTPDDLSFLASIGYKPRELFDFVEDFADEGTPAESTALLVAAVRRDYFLVSQNEKTSEKEILKNDLPSFGEEFDGIAYLPRIIAKATAKLRGELHPDVMFSCGGDRKFLRENGDIHPADFLRHVWSADGETEKLAEFVRNSAS
ncbi:MAG: hypothetical protein ACJAQT_000880 [Akkermansiaceae bacterium]|jgi:hypothetical protein